MKDKLLLILVLASGVFIGASLQLPSSRPATANSTPGEATEPPGFWGGDKPTRASVLARHRHALDAKLAGFQGGWTLATQGMTWREVLISQNMHSDFAAQRELEALGLTNGYPSLTASWMKGELPAHLRHLSKREWDDADDAQVQYRLEEKIPPGGGLE